MSIPPDDRLDRLAEWLTRAEFVCVLTGAGVSAESGLATFRGPDGLWKGRDVMELATPEAFARDPHGVWEFYRWRLLQAAKVAPNAGHVALVRLQEWLGARPAPDPSGSRFGLITQNVDRLHQRAGSRDVVELHGNITEVRCVRCPHRRSIFRAEADGSPASGNAESSLAAMPDATPADLREGTAAAAPMLVPEFLRTAEPRCPECGDWLRPCVVWFNEMLPDAAVARAAEWAERCDLFLSIGTSALVWPASGFAHTAQRNGARLVEINLEPTPLTPLAHLAIHGKSGEILPELVRRLPAQS